ncbi:MAG: PAS domain S-box-containing protein [Colwellia sp.]|jgi:PAS domain S-box-containing protein|tara:strand:- start:16351 stop:18900 length:2550 start_codon:yes stop_codon:yes gene_type:complete
MNDIANEDSLVDQLAQFKAENAKLKKINHALMERVENHGNHFAPYDAFEHSVNLTVQVREKTQELKNTLAKLERTNRALTQANSNANLFKQRFIDAIESISEAFVLLDSDGRIILQNSTFSSFWEGLGLSTDVGVNLKDLKDRAKTRGIIRHVHPGDSHNSNPVYKLSNGRWFQLNERRTMEGGWVMLYSDITALKNAENVRYEEGMANKSYLLQSLVNNLSQGVVLISSQKQIEVWNNRFAQISQLSPILLNEKPYFSNLSNLTELDLEPKKEHAYYVQILSNGTVVEIRDHHLKNGKLIKTYTDITERHRYAESLKKSERWLRLITDNVPAMIAYVGADLKFQFTNQVYLNWYGHSASELYGLEDHQNRTNFDFGQVKRYVSKALAGESVSFETEEKNLAGDLCYLLKSYVPNIDIEGQVLGFFVLIRDVTARRKNALALQKAYDLLEVRVEERTSQLQTEIEGHRQAQVSLVSAIKEADQANMSKTKFLAAVSHDLLQPLNAAQLFNSSIAEQVLNTDLAPIVNSVDASLSDLENLICTLVDISKLDAGVVQADKSTFKLADLLDNLANEYQQQASQYEVTLHYVPTDIIVHSDSVLLARVLRNFLSNAFRYTENGKVLLGCRRQGDTISIEVWDNGVGIAKEKINEIFQEFKRLKSSKVAFRNGLGLGLAIVDKISKVLNHPIKVDSIQGKGSMFSIQVPIGKIDQIAALNSLPSNVLQNTILAQRTIWVIDNDANICDGMAHLLGGWDCTVITAISLEDLKQQVEIYQDHADILIVDYHLDDNETGFSAANIINKGRTVSIPTLMITANYSKSLKNEVAQTGVLLLNKPVKPMKLKTTMLHLLR